MAFRTAQRAAIVGLTVSAATFAAAQEKNLAIELNTAADSGGGCRRGCRVAGGAPAEGGRVAGRCYRCSRPTRGCGAIGSAPRSHRGG